MSGSIRYFAATGPFPPRSECVAELRTPTLIPNRLLCESDRVWETETSLTSQGAGFSVAGGHCPDVQSTVIVGETYDRVLFVVRVRMTFEH